MLHGLGDPAVIEQTCGEIRSLGVRVEFSGADLRDAEAATGLITETVEKFGRIDILVNNAGVQHTSPVEAFPADKWELLLSVNLSAAFYTSKAAVPFMRRQAFGRIVNIASVHGLVASVHKAAYVAAKFGLVGLTKVIALETAQEPITCNALCPGFVRTALIENQITAKAEMEGVSQEEGARLLLKDKQPSQEFVMPDQVADTVMFLCSDAAQQMTGVALPLDGGWTAQ
mmetsp:Transcript_52497/g.113906  ORF Transcript_52497/g.113906 Transcript_52497/m.113906 type:complete len:229 (-) Transcript_52497:23-709(-)